ncbi:MAG TPA: glycosyltransferase 87 family protein [Thermoleophilaceae bacterium]|jgi:hypothetical protein
MEPSFRRTLYALIGCGVLMRLAWVAQTGGLPFDMQSFRAVSGALLDQPLRLYGELNPPGMYRWPYPPGYFPWVLASHGLDSSGLLGFRAAIVLPAIAADAALAWIVQAALGRGGASERTRLGAAALVALGPSFALISGYHGQIDAVAILPAVAALLVWERGGSRRALAAGLLIGLGASVKSAPGLVLLALLPTVASRREAATLIGAAVAVPLAALAPFLAADASGVVRALGYAGIPGEGGLTMIVDPDLARYWVQNAKDVRPNGLSSFLSQHGSLFTGAALLAAAGLLVRHRVEPRRAALILWLTFYVLGTGFAFQYVIWGLPFLILAGRLRWAFALQAALLVPTLIYYTGPFPALDVLVPVYFVLMAAVWLGLAAALAVTALDRRRAPVTA